MLKNFNLMSKTFYSLLALIFIFCSLFLFGVLVGHYKIFPFENLKYFKNQFLILEKDNDWLKRTCNKHDKKFSFFNQLDNNVNTNNLFIGDSVVEGLWSENFFNVAYTKIASDGNIVECLNIIGDNIILLSPKNVIIYLGGNDADGQGRQNVEDLYKTYKKFILKLNNVGSTVVIHGIHLGFALERNQEYVTELNKKLEMIALETNSFYLDPYELLDFKKDIDFDLSYDGEHLKAFAYERWLNYIHNNLPKEMPIFLSK
jgi:lysophospholipase L1-like esterase